MATIDVSTSMKKLFPTMADSTPHVSTFLDSSALSSTASDTPKNIFLVGSATDGQPGTVFEVNSLLQAKAQFGSGDLVNAMEMIWDSSADDTTNNGGTVFAVRVEDAKQASLTKGPLTFTSKVWGDDANKISVAMDKDSLTHALRIEVSYPTKNYDATYTNIGNLFKISYTGSESAAAYSVDTDATGSATSLTLKVGNTLESLSDLITFDLTSPLYSRVYQLIQAISNVSGFTAISLGFANSINSFYLDKTESPISLKDDTGAIVTAYAGCVLYALKNDKYVEPSIGALGIPSNVTATPTATGATITAASAPSNLEEFPATTLAGGSNGTVPISWADKISLVQQAQTTGVNRPYYIVALTEDENIHAELKAYCEEQSDFGYNYIGFVGTGINESVDQAISRQAQIISSRMALVAPSGYYTTLNGQNLHVPGYLFAAMAAGIASGLQVGGAITNKYINITSIDQNYSQDDLNRLDQNGVIGIKHVVNRSNTGGFAFVDDVTTYNSTSDKVLNRLYLREITDFLFDDLRTYLEREYIGVKIAQNTNALVESNVASFLDKKVAEGLIVSYDASSINVIINGEDVFIAFTADPSQEVRNIIVYGTYSNFTQTSSDTSY